MIIIILIDHLMPLTDIACFKRDALIFKVVSQLVYHEVVDTRLLC